MKMEQSVPKRRHIKFRRRGIARKKTYKNQIIGIFCISEWLTVPINPDKLSSTVLANTNTQKQIVFQGPRSAFWRTKVNPIQRPSYLSFSHLNPLNPELNPICYLLALLGAHHFLHVSRIRVKLLTFRLLMSYIYIWHIGFGGLEVACWPLVPKFAGRIFKGEKNPQHAFLRRGSKAVGPMSQICGM